MRKLAHPFAVVAVVFGFATAASAAGPPTQLFLEDDATFPSGGLTAACGFPVLVTLEGGIHIMLRTDRDGVLTELDTFSNWAVTFSAPSQGTSVAFKLGPATFVYPEGIDIGAPAVVTARGIDAHYAGFPAEAGRSVFLGEVIGVTPEGVPIADLSTVLSQTGNILPPAEGLANLCAALTA